MVLAQISVYPLRQQHLGPAVDVLLQTFARAGLSAEVGPMSTLVTGDPQRVFAALSEGFVRAAALGPTVLTMTVATACPAPTERPDDAEIPDRDPSQR